MENYQEEPTKKRNIYLKIALIFVLFLVLIIPIVWEMNLIIERQEAQRFAFQQTEIPWGGIQTITTPLLCIPFYKEEKVDNKLTKVRHTLYVTPASIQLDAGLQNSIKKRGIFKTNIYSSEVEISGKFDLKELPNVGASLQLDEAILVTGVSNPTKITESVKTKWGSDSVASSTGVKFANFIQNGIHQPVRLENKEVPFEISLKINGSRTMSFVPTGKSNGVHIQSNWHSPSFFGTTLPNKESISDKGFTADWSTSEFNRPFPNSWTDLEEGTTMLESKDFGVHFIETADHYQQNMRAVKYSFLIIGLTFMIFFFFEVIYSVRLHLFHYLLVGFALALFYVLLLSFSEHIGFTNAYIVSFLSILALITFYIVSFITQKKLVMVLVSLLTGLYSYIFVLLQLEDYALLAGALGLFVLLFIVMYFTRKTDWFQLEGTRNS